MKKWNTIKTEFEADGSLRDIYVEGTTEEDWNGFLNGLKHSSYSCSFKHGDEQSEIPSSFGAVKLLQESKSTILEINIGGLGRLNCHFFVPDEIELDLDPKDIDSESAYLLLISFLNWLALTTKKMVILTPENEQGTVLLSVRAPNV